MISFLFCPFPIVCRPRERMAQFIISGLNEKPFLYVKSLSSFVAEILFIDLKTLDIVIIALADKGIILQNPRLWLTSEKKKTLCLVQGRIHIFSTRSNRFDQQRSSLSPVFFREWDALEQWAFEGRVIKRGVQGVSGSSRVSQGTRLQMEGDISTVLRKL